MGLFPKAFFPDPLPFAALWSVLGIRAQVGRPKVIPRGEIRNSKYEIGLEWSVLYAVRGLLSCGQWSIVCIFALIQLRRSGSFPCF